MTRAGDAFPMGSAYRDAMLPEGVGRDAWLAYCMRLIYEHLSYVVELTAPCCNDMTCPRMTAANLEYRWPSEKGSQQVSAAEYRRRLLLTFARDLHDESFFHLDKNIETMDLMDDHVFDNKLMTEIDHSVLVQRTQLRSMAHATLRRVVRIYMHLYLYHFTTFSDDATLFGLNYAFRFFVCVFINYFGRNPNELAPLHLQIETVYELERNAYEQVLSINRAREQQSQPQLLFGVDAHPSRRMEELSRQANVEHVNDLFKQFVQNCRSHLKNELNPQSASQSAQQAPFDEQLFQDAMANGSPELKAQLATAYLAFKAAGRK